MATNSYAQHILLGNLGSDPVVTTMRQGNTVANFDIAVNHRNRDGSQETTWIRIAAWNGLAEIAAQYLHKGSLVLVTGTRVKASGWLDQEGEQHVTLEMTASAIRLLDGANGYGNHVLVGHLGADPRSYTTRDERTVTNFDVAINERRGDGTEVTTWYRVAAWNGLGEVCAAHLTKGRKVLVVGSRLSASVWTDQSGTIRTTLELTAETVKFLDAPGGKGQASPEVTPRQAYRNQRPVRSNEGGQAVQQSRRPTREQVLEEIPF